jgi:acetyl-CoA carboxylase beta subunit
MTHPKCYWCETTLTEEEIRDERALCPACTREFQASAERSLPSTMGDIMSEMKMHDSEMHRMYVADIDRFGKTTKATAWISGIVLIATGFAEAVSTRHWLAHGSSLVLAAGGVAILLSVQSMWWWGSRKTKSDKASRDESQQPRFP